MKFLDLTLDQPTSNLALDEALLEAAESASETSEILRLWESPIPFVVVGRASRVRDEVNLTECRKRHIPIFRRCSGGTSVLAGPGCLMYAVILSYDQHPELRQLDNAHAFVMQRLRSALANLHPSVQYQGTCDLTIGDRKISGNSLRCKRHHLLYHGTILYDFPLPLVSACLRIPPRQPAYRKARSHASFLTNLHCPVARIRDSIVQAWNARESADTWPQKATQILVEQQYSRDVWNFRL